MTVVEESSQGPLLQGTYSGERYLSNIHTLFAGESGNGKSLSTERIEWMFYERGYTIIHIIDAKNELEAAYRMFGKPTEKYHLKQLRKQNEIDLITEMPCKIYHPITIASTLRDSEGIPNKKIPPCNFFGIPLKSLRDIEINFLLELELGKEDLTFKAIENNIKKMSNEDGFYEFLHSIQEETKRKRDDFGKDKVILPNPDIMFLDAASGNIKTIDEIASLFRKFETHYFFTSQNNKYNLDFKELLLDNKNVHVFTTRYIKEDKVRKFVMLWILEQIWKTLDEINTPVLVVLEEIRVTCPKDAKGYDRILCDFLKNFLSTVRKKNASTIATTQLVSKTDEDVVNSFTEVYLGCTHAAGELDFHNSKFKLSRATIDIIKNLSKMEFYPLSHSSFGSVKINVAPFMHAEEYYKFDELYKKRFEDSMVNYKSVVDELRENYNRVREKYKDLVFDKLRKEKEKREELKKFKETKKKKEIVEEVKGELKIKNNINKERRKEDKERAIEIIKEYYVKGVDDDGNKLSYNRLVEILRDKYLIKKSVFWVRGVLLELEKVKSGAVEKVEENGIEAKNIKNNYVNSFDG